VGWKLPEGTSRLGCATLGRAIHVRHHDRHATFMNAELTPLDRSMILEV
jgi:hypothetical protein